MAGYYISAPSGVIALLVRHGATESNYEGRVRAWDDVMLDESGKIGAQLAAQKLRQFNPTRVFSSDFRRDMDTSHIIARELNLPVEPDYGLRTFDLGQLSGRLSSETEPLELELYKNPWMRAPGGESYNEFSKRGIEAFDKLIDVAAYNPPIVIVTHGKNIALIQAYISGIAPWEASYPEPAGMAIVRVGGDQRLTIEMDKPVERVTIA